MSDQDPRTQQYGQQYGQQGAQQQYGQQGGYTRQSGPRKTNTLAILALVFAFLIAPLGVVFGFIAHSQIKRTGESGSGLALAGIIIGLLAIIGGILAGILIAVAAPVIINDLPTPSPSF